MTEKKMITKDALQAVQTGGARVAARSHVSMPGWMHWVEMPDGTRHTITEATHKRVCAEMKMVRDPRDEEPQGFGHRACYWVTREQAQELQITESLRAAELVKLELEDFLDCNPSLHRLWAMRYEIHKLVAKMRSGAVS